MSFIGADRRRHAATAGAVALVHAAAFYLLLAKGVVDVAPAAEALKLFDVREVPADPVPDKASERQAPKPEGAASPANRRARPKPVVAPPPVIRVEPPPVAAPPVAAAGPDASAGAAEVEGPGTGSGGMGTGLGSGSGGSGTGGGGGMRARWVSGRIKDSDYPRSASAAEVGGTVVVHFDVGADGRVSNCRIAESSGDPSLDATTCRLIEKRFRYEPARDARGEPVEDVAGWKQDWWLEPRR